MTFTPRFDNAFKIVVGHEGGYVNHPKDPGGETKYGVTKRSYPNVDIRNLTLDGAKSIYWLDFWMPIKGDILPADLALVTFDSAINSGVNQAVRWLQQAVGSRPDGQIGPLTLAAARAASGTDAPAKMLDIRWRFMNDLSTIRTFGEGWGARLIRLSWQASRFPAI